MPGEGFWGKNTPLLVNYFILFKKRIPSKLKLVLIGNLPVQIPLAGKQDILDFGICFQTGQI